MSGQSTWQSGAVLASGPITASREQVIEFARAYDPQPFHLSDEGARDTIFGRLAASGWHTAAMAIDLLLSGADTPTPPADLVAIRDLRWRRPVYPDDALTLVGVVVQSASVSGDVAMLELTLRNQADVAVLTLQASLRLG